MLCLGGEHGTGVNECEQGDRCPDGQSCVDQLIGFVCI